MTHVAEPHRPGSRHRRAAPLRRTWPATASAAAAAARAHHPRVPQPFVDALAVVESATQRRSFAVRCFELRLERGELGERRIGIGCLVARSRSLRPLMVLRRAVARIAVAARSPTVAPSGRSALRPVRHGRPRRRGRLCRAIAAGPARLERRVAAAFAAAFGPRRTRRARRRPRCSAGRGGARRRCRIRLPRLRPRRRAVASAARRARPAGRDGPAARRCVAGVARTPLTLGPTRPPDFDHLRRRRRGGFRRGRLRRRLDSSSRRRRLRLPPQASTVASARSCRRLDCGAGFRCDSPARLSAAGVPMSPPIRPSRLDRRVLAARSVRRHRARRPLLARLQSSAPPTRLGGCHRLFGRRGSAIAGSAAGAGAGAAGFGRCSMR